MLLSQNADQNGLIASAMTDVNNEAFLNLVLPDNVSIDWLEGWGHSSSVGRLVMLSGNLAVPGARGSSIRRPDARPAVSRGPIPACSVPGPRSTSSVDRG